MSTKTVLMLSVLLLGMPLSSLAKGKERYWDGQCEVEVKYKKNGEIREKRRCPAMPAMVYPAPQVMLPAPVMVQPQPGVVIQGTLRLP